MLILVTYDVSVSDAGGTKRLNRVAKICKNFGQRVQNSVFECIVDGAQYISLKNQLLSIMDEEKDSIRFYRLGKTWENRVESFGAKNIKNVEKDPFIF